MRNVRTGLPMLLVPIFASATILDTPNTPQEQTNWCWAGSSQSVLKYYGNDIRQCEIAEYTRTHAPNRGNMGNQNCCDSPNSCNQPNYNYGQAGSIQNILQDLGKNPSITNSGVGRMLSEQESADNFDQGRPFVIWVKENGGHFIVGRGLDNHNLYYMDPWPGEGLGYGPYGDQVNGRTWGGTNVISVSPNSTPSPTPTPGPTGTPTPTPKPTATPVPTPTATPAPWPTAVPTFAPQPTWVPTRVPRPTAVPTAVPTPVPQPTWVPTRVPRPTAVPTAVPTPAPLPNYGFDWQQLLDQLRQQFGW